MSKDSVALMEMPTYGRPFQLGMLYNAISDKLIQGNELWDQTAMQKAQQDKPYLDTQFNVIQDDSFASKFHYLGANSAGLKANLLAGLTHVSGSAKFSTDHKTSREVFRVSVQFKYSSHTQELLIQQLGKIQNQAVIGATRATHVVSKVLFGLEAVLVLDRPYSAEEDASSIQEKMTNCAEFLANIYDSGKSDFTEVDQMEAKKYNFKLYSDATVPTASLTGFEKVVSILEEHILKQFKQGSSSSCLVPKKVWLSPLSELESSASSVTQEISVDNISQVEKISEDLVHAEVWINDISKNNAQVCSTIPCFRQQHAQLSNLVRRFRSDLKRQLSTLIPSIRNSTGTMDQLNSLLKKLADSPFASSKLMVLLKSMEQEIRAVTLCLKGISSIKFVSADELESLGYEYDHILCFELKFSGSHGDDLHKLEKYLQTKQLFTDSSSSTAEPWYKDGSKKRALQHKAKAFKQFSQLNSTREDVAFVVSTSTETSTSEVATIILYAEESPIEFDLPSKPIKLSASQTATNEATLTWTKPEVGSANILSYSVCHRLVKNPPNEWMIQKTIGVVESQRLPQLTSDCEYEFAVQAICKIGNGQLSDCITLTLSAPAEQSMATPPSLDSRLNSRLESTQPVILEGTQQPIGISEIPKGQPSSQTIVPIEDEAATVSQLHLSTIPPYYVPATGSNGMLTRSMPQLMPAATEQPSDNGPCGFGEQQLQPSVLFPNQHQWYGDRPLFGMEPSFQMQSSFMPASAHRVPTTDTRDDDKRKIFSEPPYLSVSKVTYKSVELNWMKPDYGQNEVESYTVYYYQEGDPDNTLKRLQIGGDESSCVVKGLTHETGYVFKLFAKYSSGVSLESKETNVVKTCSYLPETIRTRSKLFRKKTDQQKALYELTKKQTMSNREKRVAKYEVGEPNLLHQGQMKVLMVVGATGAGKTTLINGIANYVYGVQWDDDFRFVLVANEPNKKSQAHSQTSWITAYIIYCCEGSPINYSLTIIDTPGFGDTEGIERDKKIVNQIKDFFSIKPPDGIDVLHGIGFVAQASLARLSQSQRYIFDSILSIYGKDVASNIFMMTTFADGQLPPVLEAIKVAKIPHQKYFKFNNSALFVTGEDDSFDAMFWKMGVKSFVDFFNAFEKAEHRSLQLTREVLNEREQLEIVLKELQPQITAGLTKMDELQNVVIALERNKALIEQNKDFKFTVKVTKQKKVDTPRGRYTTNCLNCNYTCHDNCAIADNARKKGCWAMDNNGDCRICPDKCIWSKHVNNPYIFVLYQEDEIRTSAELKERYDTAREGESSAEAMINNIRGELEYLEDQVLKMVDKARKSLIRLDEIALKPNPLSEVDYIDKLITSEEMQRRPGWLERVNAYKQLKKRALLLRQIKNRDPSSSLEGAGPIFLSYYTGDESSVTKTYSTATIAALSGAKSTKKSSSGYFSFGGLSRLWKGK